MPNDTEKELLLQEMQRIQDRLKEISNESRSVFGRRLVYYRKLKKVSQLDLATAVGISRVQLANIELGNSDTSIKRLMKICEVLGVTPNDLLLEREGDAYR